MERKRVRYHCQHCGMHEIKSYLVDLRYGFVAPSSCMCLGCYGTMFKKAVWRTIKMAGCKRTRLVAGDSGDLPTPPFTFPTRRR